MFADFGIGPMELVVVLLVTLTALALPAWLAWRVSTKAGFPGPMGLLVLIPMGILVFLCLLAFLPWPNMSARNPATQS